MVKLFAGRWGKRLQATLLRHTVEGEQAAASLSMENGSPQFSARPILSGAEPDMRTLALFLRSREPISAEVRRWLADLCDPESEAPMRLTMQKRRRGRRKATMLEHMAAVESFIDHQADGGFEYAIARIKQDYGLSRTTTSKAVRLLRPAIEEARRLNSEG